jgi:KaiC/GvpD/RAD55 family RecA-like ATPase
MDNNTPEDLNPFQTEKPDRDIVLLIPFAPGDGSTNQGSNSGDDGQAPDDQKPIEPWPNRFDSSIIGFDDLINMDIPEKEKFLPWLAESGLVMVFGPRGIGKTFFNLSLIHSLTTGTRFMKWEVLNRTGVLLVDGEMPLRSLQERMGQFFRDGQKPELPIQFLSQEMVYHETQGDLNLKDTSIQSEITELLERSPEIRVLILDNISSLFMGLDENKKKDWEIVIQWLLRLRTKGIAVVLVHHAGKSGAQRGTSGREDHLDTVIKLEEIPAQIQIAEARFIVRFTKSRGAYGPDIEPFEAKLNLENPVYWECKPYQESTFDQMINLIREEGIDTVTEMAEALGMTKGYVSKMKRQGIQKGILRNSRKLELAACQSEAD